MKNANSLLAILLSLLIVSCKEEPGPGGNCSIHGKVYVKDYNSSFTTFISEYYGSNIYVYLIYGDDITYSKSVKTTYDGSFEFKYLRQGNYTVYTYSKDSTMTSPNGKVAVVRKVELYKKKQQEDLGNLVIFD